MRPIKYRCFIKSTKELLPVVSLVQMNDEEGIRVFPQGYARNFLTSEGNIELMQFIGLLDKNGKEIYEGDILQWDEKHLLKHQQHLNFLHTYECCFEDGSFSLKSLDEYPKNEPKFWYHIKNDCEIIGNVYENPEIISNS